MENKEVYKRYSKAVKRRDQSWFSHFAECYRYTLPQRETLFEYTKGQKKNTHLYDNTAIQAILIYANRVQQAVVPTGQQWLKITAGSRVNEDEMVPYNGEEIKLSEALDRISDVVFGYIHRSNFDMRVNEACLDLGISTGVM